MVAHGGPRGGHGRQWAAQWGRIGSPLGAHGSPWGTLYSQTPDQLPKRLLCYCYLIGSKTGAPKISTKIYNWRLLPIAPHSTPRYKRITLLCMSCWGHLVSLECNGIDSHAMDTGVVLIKLPRDMSVHISWTFAGIFKHRAILSQGGCFLSSTQVFLEGLRPL